MLPCFNKNDWRGFKIESLLVRGYSYPGQASIHDFFVSLFFYGCLLAAIAVTFTFYVWLFLIWAIDLLYPWAVSHNSGQTVGHGPGIFIEAIALLFFVSFCFSRMYGRP